jgi:asparagine synthase (glutamine-hydrolysing)
MCGIAGLVAREREGIGTGYRNSAGLLDGLGHRGPDARGEFADGRVWLGHTRLSILDVSQAANQPMATEDGRFIISYNGEVYNFSDLAKSEELGPLRTHCDTEVVLRAFEKLGTGSITRFNGMFAFAVYDRRDQKLWLVRDRLGIKPLYYRLDDHGLAFASEIKGITSHAGFSPQCNISKLHEWLYYGTTLGSETLYRGVRKLLPGHYLELDIPTFESRVVSYWHPSQFAGSSTKLRMSTDERIETTRMLVEQAVQRQLVSDVPIGVCLSGGVDSSAITAFAARHYPGRIATYSVGFDYEGGVNELPTARSIANLFGTDHHELHVTGYSVASLIEAMVDHHGAPFSDAANIPLYLLGSRLSDTTKVVLQGDGGDELFGGYRRYRTLSHFRMARFAARIAGAVHGLSRPSRGFYRRRRYLNALKPRDPAVVMALLLTEEDVRSCPENIFGPEMRRALSGQDPFARYRESQARVRSEDLVNQMLMVDLSIILPDIFLEKVDRATMAASVESRVPFLDNDLVEFCLRLSGPDKVPSGQSKWLLKKALEGIVPETVLHARKTGFGVPYGFWLRTVLRSVFLDNLDTFAARNPGILDVGTIRRIHDDHVERRRDRAFLLWKVLNLMVWSNRHGVEFDLAATE